MSKPLQYTLAGSGLLAAYGLLFVLEAGAVDAYVEEDGVVETLGALALFAASVLFAMTLFRSHGSTGVATVKKVALALLSVLFFFGAGEEISWGQRIFEIETPAGLVEDNAQEETNVHNLRALGGWLEMDRLFKVFWFGFGIVLPIAAAASSRIRGWASKLVPILPIGLAIALISNQGIAELSSLVAERNPSLFAGELDFAHARFEVTEALVGVIFAFGALALFRAGAGDEPTTAGIDSKAAERLPS